jgi:transaldolase
MSARRQRAVFLDRDGVLNRVVVRDGRPHPPGSLGELVIPDEVVSATQTLADAGFVLICATNQPDVARGSQSREAVDDIHRALRRRLPLADVLVSFADGEDPRRKPNPGMLLEAAERYDIDLGNSFMVGDRWKDAEAGRRAGCKTVHIERDYAEAWAVAAPDFRVRSLTEAARCILSATQPLRAQERLAALRVEIFADGADRASMLALYAQPLIRGFTTNPTLMRKAGITSYEAFARDILQAIPDRPISLSVFSDDFAEMEEQARQVAEWGDNVYVKIPISDTQGRSAIPLVQRLVDNGLKLNVTAAMTIPQVEAAARALADGPPACISVFAGRLADSGLDPVPIMRAAVDCLRAYPNVRLIWASPREVLNVFQADEVGCHIITVTKDILDKLPLVGKDPDTFSLETVRMFHRDAMQAGFRLGPEARSADETDLAVTLTVDEHEAVLPRGGALPRLVAGHANVILTTAEATRD